MPITPTYPGNYRFIVKSISRSDGKTISQKSIDIHIAQPWWNSGRMAWMIYTAIFVALIYLAWQFYHDRLEHRYYDEKIMFQNTAHDIRNPPSLVPGPTEWYKEDSTLERQYAQLSDIARRNEKTIENGDPTARFSEGRKRNWPIWTHGTESSGLCSTNRSINSHL